MSRKFRQLSKSGIYHILLQGYNKTQIFKSDSEKNFFINILFHNLLQNNSKIFAYCITDDHAHLLIWDVENMLSKLIKEITKKYAYYINKKYERSGKVFHDRFKSEPIEDIESLISILAFIHNHSSTNNSVKYQRNYELFNCNSYLSNDYIDHSSISINKLLKGLYVNNNVFIKLPIKPILNTSNHKFIDCNNTQINTHKTILSETQAKIFINDYLENSNQSLESIKTNWKLRSALIGELKEKSNLSIKKIAELLSLTRGIVQNIK